MSARTQASTHAAHPAFAAIVGLGGLAATAVDVALLTLLVETGCAVGPAAWLGACAGAVVAFFFNRRVAFRDRSPLHASQVARFLAVALTSAIAMAAAMHVCATVIGIPYLLAKVICSVLVFLGWSLPAQRRLVFGSSFDPSASLASI